jgi:alpha-ketoglutarate-dependent taurine dioxygenase
VNDSKTHGKLVTFEDNTEIRQEDAEVCHEVMNRISVALKWKKGDVVLVDNRLALHARRTYLPPRRIYAALFK